MAGKTGVGKSTLINAVFRGELARTGAGKPVTSTTQEFTRPGHPLTIIDTRGLEVADYEASRRELDALIRERGAAADQERHIHIAWLCIQDSSHRVEDAEIALCNMLADAGIPVITVLTKARKNSPFADTARELLPRARQVVPVRALPERIDELDADLPPMGLDELIAATAQAIPRRSSAYANALSTRNKQALEVKKRAEIEVNIAAGLAASPPRHPFSDAFALVPIQVGMIAKIGITFGMELDTAAITTLVTSTLGASAATLIGRSVVSSLLADPGRRQRRRHHRRHHRRHPHRCWATPTWRCSTTSASAIRAGHRHRDDRAGAQATRGLRTRLNTAPDRRAFRNSWTAFAIMRRLLAFSYAG